MTRTTMYRRQGDTGSSGGQFTLVFVLRLMISALLVASLACAQDQRVQTLLTDLRSPDLGISRAAFYSLVGLAGSSSDDIEDRVSALLERYRSDADAIRRGLISALENADDANAESQRTGVDLGEDFGSFWPDLIWAVGSLRDPRAGTALVGALGTGGMATNFVADIFPFAVDALIAKLSEPDRYMDGYRVPISDAAFSGFISGFTRVSLLRSHPDALEKSRGALLQSLDSPDFVIRRDAVYSLRSLLRVRDDVEVRARLMRVSSTDSYAAPEPRRGRGQTQFPVRDAVTYENPGELQFVLRSSTTGACTVSSQVPENPDSVLIGPVNDSVHQMCTHRDRGRRDPDLCWSVPSNTCRQ